MRAFEIQAFGSADGLGMAERPDAPLAPGEVRLAMRSASLNYRDLLVLRGMPGVPFGRIPLSDGAGEVIEIGSAVTRWKAGDRVMPIFKQSWLGGDVTPADNMTALGGAMDGVLAERAVFSQDGLVGIPAHLSFDEAATLPCAAVTAWSALQDVRQLIAGDSVLVLGTGGVAIFALQFARAAGARVIITSSSDAKIGQALKMGASAGINYRTTADWGAEARRLTGGRGVDLVVETGGSTTLAESMAACRLGGAIALVGVRAKGMIDPMPIIGSNLRLRGIGVGSRQAFEAMNRAIDLDGLRPVISDVFEFAAAPDAYRALEKAGHFGKIVIKIS